MTDVLKTKRDIVIEGGKIMQQIHSKVKSFIKIGISTQDIDDLVRNLFKEYGVTGYVSNDKAFNAVCCVSIDDCLCHGIPSKSVRIQHGTILSVDIFFNYQGYWIDCARTLVAIDENIGITPSIEKLQSLIAYNQKLLNASIEAANKLLKDNKQVTYGFFGNFMDDMITKSIYSVSHYWIGHKIGTSLHESPLIPSAMNNEKQVIQENDTFCVEPIISFRSARDSYSKYVRTTMNSNWNILNLTGQPTSHYENTFFMHENRIISLT